jgi:hypothetical protein
MGVLILAIGLMGCGSDGVTTDEAAPVNAERASAAVQTTKSGYLDKPELDQEAARICAQVSLEAEEDLDRFRADHGIDPAEQLTALEEREIGEEIILPNAFKQTREIINLGVRHGQLEDESEEAMDAFVAAIEKGERHPAVAVTETARLFAKANRLAKGMGFEACQTR